jgi:hypothetical protein
MMPSCIDVCHFFIDELKIKPKEEKMEEKDIKLDVHTVVNYGDGTNSVYVPISEAIRAGEEAKRIMEEDKIKEGDFVWYDTGIKRIKSVEMTRYWLTNASWVTLSSVTKITNPAHIKALKEIFEAMK